MKIVLKDSLKLKQNLLSYPKVLKDTNMDEITDLLSQKRLDKYKDVSKDAVSCHLFNCELAESFYSSLSYFEIILRNKIDKVFSKYLGDDWIFKDEYIIGRNQDNMKMLLPTSKILKRIRKIRTTSYPN